jgi:hypothetical protein
MFYSWQSLSAFNEWHHRAMAFLGIPYPGRNARTGQIDEDAQWTDAYTNPIVVNASDVRAFVEEDIAISVSDGLGSLTDPPIVVDDD